MSIHSPLRYPGGKAKFAELVRRSIRAHASPSGIFVEPFCGGAGVALSLLASGDVQRISLNDLDPLVASFWQVVFGRSDKSETSRKADFTWLRNRIESIEITVDEWLAQKNSTPSSIRSAAFKCLFLNRTSFNGILHQAGPIGGWGQKNRTLDVRFNREKLLNRVNWLWEMRAHVDSVTCIEWHKVFSQHSTPSSFIYLDPPYYHRAEQLYGYLFDEDAHRKMRDLLVACTSTPWLLSYDDSVEVRELYKETPGVDGLIIDKTYSAHPLGGGRFIGRELFFSNRPMKFDNNGDEKDHSAVSVVGRLATAPPPKSGPARSPIHEYTLQRRKTGIASALLD